MASSATAGGLSEAIQETEIVAQKRGWHILGVEGNLSYADLPGTHIVYEDGRGTKRWSRNFGPFVKVDQLVKEVIPNDETKEPFA